MLVRVLLTVRLKGIGKSSPFTGDAWIIGGKSLYEKYIDYVDEVHLSYINKRFDCDTKIDIGMFLGYFEFVSEQRLSESVKVMKLKRKTND